MPPAELLSSVRGFEQPPGALPRPFGAAQATTGKYAHLLGVMGRSGPTPESRRPIRSGFRASQLFSALGRLLFSHFSDGSGGIRGRCGDFFHRHPAEVVRSTPAPGTCVAISPCQWRQVWVAAVRRVTRSPPRHPARSGWLTPRAAVHPTPWRTGTSTVRGKLRNSASTDASTARISRAVDPAVRDVNADDRRIPSADPTGEGRPAGCRPTHPALRERVGTVDRPRAHRALKRSRCGPSRRTWVRTRRAVRAVRSRDLARARPATGLVRRRLETCDV